MSSVGGFARVGRPGLVGIASSTSMAADAGVAMSSSAASGSVQQRQVERTEQHYAAAQYQAQRQFVQQQRAMYPDGNLPSVREYAKETPPQPPSAPAPAVAAMGAASSGAVLDRIRQLAALRTDDTLTDAEFTAATLQLLR